MAAPKKRDSNIELFRIIMMLSIVAHHYVVSSGITDIIAIPPYSWQAYFLYIFGLWGKIGINCFVLITGYYMCQSSITIRKFLKLLLEIVFYNIIIYLIFVLSGYEPFSLLRLYMVLLPVGSIMDNFVPCFLVYYLLIPFLNVLVQNINRNQHKMLLAICFICFVIFDHLPFFEYRFNYVGWFCILHVIASYIRFYHSEQRNDAVHTHAYIGTAIALAVLTVLVQLKLTELGLPAGKPFRWVADCNAVFAVITSILLFVGFKNMKINYSCWINTIASSTFAVLLIHAHSTSMQQWLWHDVCHNTDWIFSPYIPLHAFGCVIAIFMACVIIDRIRIHLLENPTFIVIDKWLTKHNKQ